MYGGAKMNSALCLGPIPVAVFQKKKFFKILIIEMNIEN